jgi:hypothetical protein
MKVRDIALCVGLAIVGAVQYWDWETLHGPFLLDDRGTVSQNPSVIEAANPKSWARVWTCAPPLLPTGLGLPARLKNLSWGSRASPNLLLGFSTWWCGGAVRFARDGMTRIRWPKGWRPLGHCYSTAVRIGLQHYCGDGPVGRLTDDEYGGLTGRMGINQA